jgi:hypothetical protein
VLAGAVVLAAKGQSIAGEDTAIAELRAFIAVPVKARFEAALAARDSRFLGVYGYTLEVPGVPQAEADRISKNGVLGIPGTSDALVSEEHGALNERAREYAVEYNTLLLRHLSRGVRRGTPPNKRLQLTSHSAFQSIRGTVWHRTQALRTSRGGAVARS